MIPVGDCMKKNVISIQSTMTIDQAARLLCENHIGTLPVVNSEGHLVGLLTLQSLLTNALPDFVKLLDDLDFVKNFGAAEERLPSPEWLNQPVSKIMLGPQSVEETNGLLHVIALLNSHQLHDLPVVNRDGKLTGIVSRVDVGTSFLKRWIKNEGGYS